MENKCAIHAILDLKRKKRLYDISVYNLSKFDIN
jgi:hypothetical protein